MFENLDLGTIITIVLGLVTTFAGGFWLKAKGKIKAVVNLGSEAFDLINVLQKALEDDKISKEEIKQLKKEGGDVSKAWKALLKKS